MITAYLPCSFYFTFFLLLFISTSHFAHFSLTITIHLFRFPIFCLVLPSFSLGFNILFYTLCFSIPSYFLLLLFSIYFPSYSNNFLLFVSSFVFFLFFLTKFRLLCVYFFCPFFPYLVLPGFLLPLYPAVCCRQLSLQGRLASYFCPC